MNTTPEKNAAEQIRMAVQRLNNAVADACREHGLSVEYETHRMEQVGMPSNEFLVVKVRKDL